MKNRSILMPVLLMVATSFMFVSCSKEGNDNEVGTESEKSNDNPLVETVWASSYGEYVLWIEFTSDSEFLEYMGDSDGNTNSTGVSYGTYKYSDGYVHFVTHVDSSPFDYATVKGSVMNLVYKTGYERTYKKRYLN